jgi:ribosomal protein S18 acetylase RimI-like enzyme
VRIREVSVADHDAALAVWRAANAAFLGEEGVGPEQEARVRAHLATPDAFLLLAEDDGAAVGTAVGMHAREDDGAGPPIPGFLHVAMVYVAPDRWGEGIGRALTDELLALARDRGYTRAQLWTHAHNDHAQRLYEGKGFVPSGREQVVDGLRIVHYLRNL